MNCPIMFWVSRPTWSETIENQEDEQHHLVRKIECKSCTSILSFPLKHIKGRVSLWSIPSGSPLTCLILLDFVTNRKAKTIWWLFRDILDLFFLFQELFVLWFVPWWWSGSRWCYYSFLFAELSPVIIKFHFWAIIYAHMKRAFKRASTANRLWWKCIWSPGIPTSPKMIGKPAKKWKRGQCFNCVKSFPGLILDELLSSQLLSIVITWSIIELTYWPLGLKMDFLE